jgi:hypothetical protein
MAAGDIMPVVSEHGGHNRTVSFPGNTGAAFVIGELVQVNNAGVMDEVAAGPTIINVTNDSGVNGAGATFDNVETAMVAATDASANIARIGDGRYVDPANVGILHSAYLFDDQTEFVTRNVFSGSDTNIGPAGDNTQTLVIGEQVGLRTTAGGVHGLEAVGTGLIVTRIVDAQGRDVSLSGAADDKIYFRRVNDALLA